MIEHDLKVSPSKAGLKRDDQLAWKIAGVAVPSVPSGGGNIGKETGGSTPPPATSGTMNVTINVPGSGSPSATAQAIVDDHSAVFLGVRRQLAHRQQLEHDLRRAAQLGAQGRDHERAVHQDGMQDDEVQQLLVRPGRVAQAQLDAFIVEWRDQQREEREYEGGLS